MIAIFGTDECRYQSITLLSWRGRPDCRYLRGCEPTAVHRAGGRTRASDNSPYSDYIQRFGGNRDTLAQSLDRIQESTLTLRNSVLWNNTDTAGANSDETAQIFDEPVFGANVVSVEYSCVQDDDPDDAGVYPGSGNIDDDPLFVDAEGSDLHLLPGSPGIDAAKNSAVSLDVADLDGDGDTGELVPFDLDGNPRFVDDPNTDDCPQPGADCGAPPIVDMGACEFRDGDQSIPAVSEWRVVVMTLLVLTVGTLIMAGRRQAGQAI